MNNIERDKLPTISVITAVFNGERYLEESIKSVINQTYPNFEYLIIDGGSSDRTVDILKKYDKSIDFWISEPDKGIYDAWNKALQRITGEWICFLGADDFFLSRDVFSQMASELVKWGRLDKKYIYGAVRYVSPDKSNVIATIGVQWDQIRDAFRNKMTLMHAGAFHHNSLFKIHGNFNAHFKITGDYEFLLREYRRNHDFAVFADLPVIAMRSGGVSGSLENRLLMAKEMSAARKLNELKGLSFPIVFWTMRIKFYILVRKIVGPKASNYLADVYRLLTGKKRRWSVN
jgi:glycosyltransferase involved in cell wall biosynthesis